MGDSGEALAPGRSRRRRAPRIRVRLGAAYEDPGGQVFLQARDLSETGAWLALPDPPFPGAQARLTFELPGASPIVRVRATVVRRREEAPAGFAVHFGPIPEETRRAIRGYVAAALSAAGRAGAAG